MNVTSYKKPTMTTSNIATALECKLLATENGSTIRWNADKFGEMVRQFERQFYTWQGAIAIDAADGLRVDVADDENCIWTNDKLTLFATTCPKDHKKVRIETNSQNSTNNTQLICFNLFVFHSVV